MDNTDTETDTEMIVIEDDDRESRSPSPVAMMDDQPSAEAMDTTICIKRSDQPCDEELRQSMMSELTSLGRQLPWDSDSSDYVCSPLHYAVKFEDVSVVRELLTIGAAGMIELKNLEGDTPVHLAAKLKRHVVLEALLSGLVDSAEYPSNPANPHGLTHFHVACMLADERVLAEFLIADRHLMAPIDERVSEESKLWPGYTPLHFAVDYDRRANAKLLCEKSADICVRNGRGLTPLHLAIRRHDLRMVDVLCAAVRDVKAENPADSTGLSHLHIACLARNQSLVERYMQHCRELNLNAAVSMEAPLWPGYTPLHLAVEFDRSRAVESLLRNGADPRVVELRGASPMHLACRLGSERQYRLAQELHQSDEPNADQLQMSFAEKHVRMFEQRLAKENDYILSVYELLAKGADVNARDNFGRTPLHYAMHWDSTALQTLTEDRWAIQVASVRQLNIKRLTLVQRLLENGADPNAVDNLGCAVLHALVDTENLNIEPEMERVIGKLARNGCDLSVKSWSGQTLLHAAVKKGCGASVRLLVKNGADVNAVETVGGCTPLHATYYNKTGEILDFLLVNGADVDARNAEGNTLLHLIMKRESLEKQPQSQLDGGESVLEAMKICTVPVYIAPLDGFFRPFGYDLGMYTSLLLCNCDVNVRNNRGETPLHLACRLMEPARVSVLLSYGADVNLEDLGTGSTPLMLVYVPPQFENSNNRAARCFHLLRKHVNALRSFGLFVSKKNESHCADIERYRSESSRSAEFARQTRAEQTDLIIELERLKDKRISRFKSLHDVLFMESRDLVTLLHNKFFTGALMETDFVKTYPLSAYLLKLQFCKALIRQDWMEHAKKTMNLASGELELPDNCLERIFHSLTDEDLKNLARTCNSNTIEIVQRVYRGEEKVAALQCLQVSDSMIIVPAPLMQKDLLTEWSDKIGHESPPLDHQGSFGPAHRPPTEQQPTETVDPATTAWCDVPPSELDNSEINW